MMEGSMIAFGLTTSAPVLTIIWYLRVRHRACMRARSADLLLCWGCMYDLRALRRDGVAGGGCPECGGAFQFAQLRRYWSRFVRKP